MERLSDKFVALAGAEADLQLHKCAVIQLEIDARPSSMKASLHGKSNACLLDYFLDGTLELSLLWKFSAILLSVTPLIDPFGFLAGFELLVGFKLAESVPDAALAPTMPLACRLDAGSFSQPPQANSDTVSLLSFILYVSGFPSVGFSNLLLIDFVSMIHAIPN